MAYYTKNGTQNYAVNLNQASSTYTPANSSGYDCTTSVVTGAIDSSYRAGSSTIYTVLLEKYTMTVTLTGTYASSYLSTLSVTNNTHPTKSWSVTCDGSTFSWNFEAYYGDSLTINYTSYTGGGYTYVALPYVNNSLTTSMTVTGEYLTIDYRCNSRSCGTCSATTTCGSSSSCSTCSAVTTCGKSSSGSTCIIATCRRSSGQ